MFTVAGFHVPVSPFTEVVGSTGADAPAQMVMVSAILKTGITPGVTVIVKITGSAHWPAAGVKVYTAEAWLSITPGSQTPVILLAETGGSNGASSPEQIVIELPKLNDGVTIGLTCTFNCVCNAHCPASGVKVYTALV